MQKLHAVPLSPIPTPPHAVALSPSFGVSGIYRVYIPGGVGWGEARGTARTGTSRTRPNHSLASSATPSSTTLILSLCLNGRKEALWVGKALHQMLRGERAQKSDRATEGV